MSAKLVIAIFLASLAVGCALAAQCDFKYSLSEDKKSSLIEVSGDVVVVNQSGGKGKWKTYHQDGNLKTIFNPIFEYKSGFMSLKTEESIFPRMSSIKKSMIYLENKDTGKFFLLNNQTAPDYLHTFVEGQVVTVVSNYCALEVHRVDTLKGEFKDIVAQLMSGDLMPQH